MPKQVIFSEKGPRPLGAYSQAIRAGDFIFVAGMGGIDPATGQMVPGGIREQTRRALENIKAVLESAGASLKDVVKVTVFLARAEDFNDMNDVYREYFKEEPPARSTVAGNIPGKNFLVEIDAIAYVGKQ
ncbi:MAG: Rid family detoxifying hydrolase [Halobacteria archaeon]